MKHLNKLPYVIIFILIVTLLFVQNVIYVRTIDNAIIFGITKKEVVISKKIDPYENETLEETIARGDKLLEETELIMVDARNRGYI